MSNKGVTLMELLVVIIVISILATVSVISVDRIITNQREKVDLANAKHLGDAINLAYLEGTIIIKNNRLYNTDSERGYAGTGTWFFDDMSGYIKNRIVPQASIAQNTHNANGGTYRFFFGLSGQEVTVFYYDENKTRINLYTFILEGN